MSGKSDHDGCRIRKDRRRSTSCSRNDSSAMMTAPAPHVICCSTSSYPEHASAAKPALLSRLTIRDASRLVGALTRTRNSIWEMSSCPALGAGNVFSEACISGKVLPPAHIPWQTRQHTFELRECGANLQLAGSERQLANRRLMHAASLFLD